MAARTSFLPSSLQIARQSSSGELEWPTSRRAVQLLSGKGKGFRRWYADLREKPTRCIRDRLPRLRTQSSAGSRPPAATETSSAAIRPRPIQYDRKGRETIRDRARAYEAL